MEKKEAKIELIKIFSEVKYEQAYIDESFIMNFIKTMWKNTFENCKSAIKSGRKEIIIDDFIVGSYAGGYPAHERSSVYERMVSYIQKELDNSEIPYTTDQYTMNKITRFIINMDELKKFSNFEKLQILKE